jgi:AcrR family transcriptional regulator
VAHVPAEERRRQLINAAIDVIATDGLAKATTRAITTHANVPLAAMHYCFRSKEDLLKAVAQEVIERTHPWVGRVETGRGLAAAIRSITHELWEWLHRDPNVQIALMEVLVWNARNSQEAAVGDRVYQPTFELLAGALEEAASESGEQAGVPLRDLTRLIVAGVDGAFMQYLATGDRQAIDPTVAQLADTAVSLAAIRTGPSKNRKVPAGSTRSRTIVR